MNESVAIKRVRKPRKAILQIGLLFMVVFIIVLCLFAIIVALGSIKLYLSGKNDRIEQDLKKMGEVMSDDYIPHLSWALDYWRNNPDAIRSERLDYKYFTYGEDETELCEEAQYPFEYTTEEIMALPEEKQLEVACVIFNSLANSLSFFNYAFDFSDAYIIDLTEENWGFIYYDSKMYIEDPEGLGLGVVWEYNPETHFAAQQYKTSGETDISYDIVTDPTANTNEYIGYLPVYIDGEFKCAVCISYDWTPYAQEVTKGLKSMMLGGLVVGIIAAVLLMLIIFKVVIRPLSIVTKSVEKYTENKDSAEVIKKMSKVRSKNEVGVLVKDFALLANEMDHYAEEVSTLASEKERVKAELEMGAKIQMSMLPSDYPESDAFELYASMDPAKEVGGDFYDFFMIDDNHLGLVIADVSGKGVPAAMFMAMSKMYIRTFASSCKSPAEALIKANKAIDANNENQMFVTVWLGIVDLNTGHVVAANAGHEYPVIRKNEGQFEVLKDKHSLMLGAFPNIKSIDYEFDLGKGDTLFVYTDGAPEANDKENNMFGMDRLVESLNKEPDDEPVDLIKAMKQSISEFVGDADQFDDLTMLCFKYKGRDSSEA